MAKWLVSSLCVSLFGSLLLARASRAEGPVQTASVELRAWGTHGEVRPLRAARPAHEPELAREVNAGSIPRQALRLELARGIGRFLQQVRTSAVLASGQFKGWRMVALFPTRAEVHVRVLRPGDIVMRVNGRSLERPEELKALWDTLAAANELTLDIERDGKTSKLRYTVVD